MSTRYSLRQTPKKVNHAGFVETPRPRGPNRRKSQFPDDDTDDSSSAAETRPPLRTTRSSSRKISVMDPVATNGHAVEGNGHAVKTNGHANGGANGSVATNGVTTGSNYAATNGEVDSKALALAEKKVEVEQKKVIDGWVVGSDPKIDSTGHMEFGGSWGVGAIMLGFPTLMYYMWIGATFYDGKPPTPEEGQSFVDFAKYMGDIIYEHAFPSFYAFKVFWIYMIFEALLYCWMPGVYTYGKPLAHMGGKQLKYYCSGMFSWYATIVLMGVLHYTQIFPLYILMDQFGPIMSVAIISGFLVSFGAYFSAIARGAQHRMTGYPVYDFFMGAELNPRIGILDMKMFFELRLPWFILFGLSCATAARQYENYGYVSGEVCLQVLAHFLYANACAKGEELITTTWDMYYEKWGFMLIFWNFAGVPLSYCHSTLYLANHHPDTYRWNRYALSALYVAYLFVYWVWDTTNSQKNRFRAEEKGTLLPRKSFPQLPWQTVKNPRIIRTNAGQSILVDGWYGYARKIHYTCDFFFALSWGLLTGFNSPFPYFYPFFFFCMILHRALRDEQKCAERYGEAWVEYKKAVPYVFIPYVI